MYYLKNGLIFDVENKKTFEGSILIKEGKIVDIIEGRDEKDITDVKVIDCEGLYIYPGLVEAHSHLGLDGYAIGYEGKDYNEMNDIITPQLRAIDAFNPQDESIALARKGGVTCVATGPGSANVLGGMFVAVKTVGKRVDDMVVKFPIAMKCAFGENPKRVYKDINNFSRMSTAFKLRDMLRKAVEYDAKIKAAQGDITKMPNYDGKLEALLPVVRKELPLKAHAHRADDIFTAIRIAKEFDVKLTIEHCTDGALIAEDLAKEGYPVAVGPTFGHATKYELRNKSFETPGILAKHGCKVSIITDAPVIPQQNLGMCAGFAVKAGMDEFEALRAITINPAEHIGIQDRVGSIKIGKDADFAICDGNIMYTNTNVIYTIIDGKIEYSAKEE